MKKLCAIGEALIDFIPNEKGKRLKDVISFKQVVGGAPANVAVSISKLGGKSILLTKLGEDAFGDKIDETLRQCGVDTRYVLRSQSLDTSLAFVSLTNEGNREFKFYRKTAADLDYSRDDLPIDAINECSIVHFCSVSLVDSPMKEAHKKLISHAIHQHILVSFDFNLRLSLWEKPNQLKKAVNEFYPLADILKLSDEEVEFITGYPTIIDALPILFQGRCQLVIYTMGKRGATCYFKEGTAITVPGIEVDVVDTTGAGDSFIGAFLFKLLENEEMDLTKVSHQTYNEFLEFSNYYAAHTTTKEGALDALASLDEIKKFIKNQKGAFLE